MFAVFYCPYFFRIEDSVHLINLFAIIYPDSTIAANIKGVDDIDVVKVTHNYLMYNFKNRGLINVRLMWGFSFSDHYVTMLLHNFLTPRLFGGYQSTDHTLN